MEHSAESGHLDVLTSLTSVERLADEWRGLNFATGGSYFAGPDWVLSWWGRFARDLRVEVAVWRNSFNQLEGVVPILETSTRLHRRVPIPVRYLSNLGSGAGAADHCGWAAIESRWNDVRDWLSERASSQPLLIRSLPPSSSILLPAGARAVAATMCPRLEIPSDPNEIGSSSKFRKQIRYYLRRIRQEGVTLRWIGAEDLDESTLDSVLDLHRRRTAAADRTTSFRTDRLDFHLLLIERARPGEGPVVVLAEHEGNAIGAIYGFLWGDTFSFYQSGWDPDWAASNLGTVLIAEAIAMSAERGAAVFDFLRGDEAYKWKFGASPFNDETWLIPSGWSGKALAARIRLGATS